MSCIDAFSSRLYGTLFFDEIDSKYLPAEDRNFIIRI